MAMYLGSNKVEIGQSGGGGSSDFSTAQVTIVDNTSGRNLNIPYIVDTPPSAIVSMLGTQGGGETIVRNVPLYKGNLGVVFDPALTITTSGDIQLFVETTYLITGDCTITIS